ncbi:MAG: hypothetical protein V3U92_20080 [Cellulophaga sp.]
MIVKKVIIISLLIISGVVNSQNKIIPEFTADAWEVKAKNHEFKEYKGKRALYLDNGKARLKNSSFKNGIIEYDISFEKGRNFAGVHFRIQDKLNYEELYLRPHQSGNDDSIQYAPVINGNGSWQLYHGEGHWAAFNYEFGEWMHVKIVISNTKMDVFIDDMDSPILHVHDLKRELKTGALGFGTFLGATYYANLTYQEIENPTLSTKTNPSDMIEKGTVLNWQVSKAFSSDKLKQITALKNLDITVVQRVLAERSGTLNLSRVSSVSNETNAIIAKFNIDSDSEQLKELHFGYSDKVIVFVNGKAVYTGDNSFRTRDYRYLGSIGYFDTIFLSLKKGKNEIAFALTERMGGWGVKAKLGDNNGIAIE